MIRPRLGLHVVVVGVVACVIAGVGGPRPASAQKLVLLVRHAEKVDDSDDAALTSAGLARAQRLAAVLKDAGVTTVYATPWQRTINTVKPLADKAKLVVQKYEDPAALLAKLKSAKPDEVVLVAGHTTNLPEILKLLGHQAPVKIEHTEFDNLFVVAPRGKAPPVVTRLRYP